MSGKVAPAKEEFGVCGCFTRSYIHYHSMALPLVEKLFQKYADNGLVTPEKLKLFLNEEQKETTATLEDAERIVNQVAKEKHFFTLRHVKHGLTVAQFFDYLTDPALNLAINTKTHHDMTLPASAYFIFTGHNSYLTGNQLSSDCSEKPIVDALLKGVRVIELDLWPSKNETAIKVYHGRTMTAPVDFQVCLEAIRDNAFKASKYPVVITFEDHLTTTLQAEAAKITVQVLGEKLWYPGDDARWSGFTAFPSPEDVKERILISTKPPKEFQKGEKHDKIAQKKQSVKEELKKAAQTKDASSPAPTEKTKKKPGLFARAFGTSPPKKPTQAKELKLETEDRALKNVLATEKGVAPTPSDKAVVGEGALAEVSDDDEDTDDDVVEDDDAPDHVKNPAYARIISIRAGKPKGASLIETLVVDENVKRVSLSEPQLEKVAEENPFALIKFTEKNLLRIYPYGLRLNSSNYNPLLAWSHGAQMVAFNMQGYGKPLWLVHGFFRQNGGCGYVKKPDFLFPSKNSGREFDPRVPQARKVTLKVKAIMGLGWKEKFDKRYFDQFSPPDFYLKLAIAGLPQDKKKAKTQPIEDDWTPKWEEEFEFPISVPELALLRLEVREYDMAGKDDFGGQTCIPLSEIKEGYRSLPLNDKKGSELTGVRLLLHFELQWEKKP
ncbi:hypothetical protein R1sor_023489 [Riccia sorocarpa]|uniref:Phosphoinositide phospholipase C n=1 Tax=Riccia sorocarpa TaxID=122646 RepID=A0ABD3GMW8_9MARC